MYDIKIKTEKQMLLLIDALDLYTRIKLGQLEIIPEVYSDTSYETLYTPEFTAFKEKLTGMPVRASHGICSDKVEQNAKEVYTMKKLMQKAVAEKNLYQNGAWSSGNNLNLSKLEEIVVTLED